MADDLLWYAGYGSNLDRVRFGCYLDGGRPPGATKTYPGAREPGPPRDERAFTMPGRVVFGFESPTWGGGVAFYDPDGDGVTLARAYLVTERQLVDVLEQEMWRDPAADHDLAEVLTARRQQVGPGRYETLHLVGELEGRPVLTFSAPVVAEQAPNPPSRAYLATVVRGLLETHGLAPDAVADYLLACGAVAPTWSRDGLVALAGEEAGSVGGGRAAQ